MATQGWNQVLPADLIELVEHLREQLVNDQMYRDYIEDQIETYELAIGIEDTNPMREELICQRQNYMFEQILSLISTLR